MMRDSTLPDNAIFLPADPAPGSDLDYLHAPPSPEEEAAERKRRMTEAESAAAIIADRAAALIADYLPRALRDEIADRATTAMQNSPDSYRPTRFELEEIADRIADSLPEKAVNALVESTGALVERAIDSASGNGA